MIAGIGIDTVDIEDIRSFLTDTELSRAYRERTFTPAELEAAAERSDPAEYLAGRFAAKEAVFKALAPHTPEKTFDLRITETLTRPDGSPYINVTDALASVMRAAGASRLHISITTEGHFATAFVIAESV